MRTRSFFHRFIDQSLRGELTALVAGALCPLAFAPFNIFPIAIISLALLLATWLHVEEGRAFWRGWCFGFGLFATGIYWVYISMHTYGNLPPLYSALLTALLAALLALFPACAGYTLNRFYPNNTEAKVFRAFPAIWVLFEWLRSWMFTGFPWLIMGYSQLHSPLVGIASFLGVFGVSLFVASNAAALVFLSYSHYHTRRIILYLIISWPLLFALNFIHWTHPVGPRQKVALVQGNIPQSMKWSPEQSEAIIKKYATLSQHHWDHTIVIWPEAAVPMRYFDAKPRLTPLFKQAKQHHGSLISGIILSGQKPSILYNAIISGGDAHGQYKKRQLVPFGEWFILPDGFKPLFSLLNIPMSNLSPGPYVQKPIIANGIRFASFICYESAFPELVGTSVQNNQAILVISDDAWFGHSIAQAQHLQMAQMRAIETGRYLLSVTNNGLTAVINPHGVIKHRAEPFKTTVLTASLRPMTGSTYWQSFGMNSLIATLFSLLFFSARRRRREPPFT
jgi:apolipoprotein N-acyltransferase